MFTTGSGADWAGRAIVRPVFGPNGASHIASLPLFAALKYKSQLQAFLQQDLLQHNNEPYPLSPDAIYDLKMCLRRGLCPYIKFFSD